MFLSSRKEIIERFARHEKDTGSAEVQVAILTDKIASLTEHLKANKKDHHSRRGLFLMISHRRNLLRYLYRSNISIYENVVSRLGVRSIVRR